MTGLRRHLLEDLHLRGLAPRIQPCSPEAVKHLAAHDRLAPDQSSAEEIRQDLLYLIKDKQVAASPRRIHPLGSGFDPQIELWLASPEPTPPDLGPVPPQP